MIREGGRYYRPCLIHPHNPLSKVCVRPTCIYRNILCEDCIKQCHTNHETMDVYKLAQVVQGINDGRKNSESADLAKQLKHCKSKACQLISATRIKIAKELQSLKVVESYFDKVLGLFDRNGVEQVHDFHYDHTKEVEESNKDLTAAVIFFLAKQRDTSVKDLAHQVALAKEKQNDLRTRLDAMLLQVEINCEFLASSYSSVEKRKDSALSHSVQGEFPHPNIHSHSVPQHQHKQPPARSYQRMPEPHLSKNPPKQNTVKINPNTRSCGVGQSEINDLPSTEYTVPKPSQKPPTAGNLGWVMAMKHPSIIINDRIIKRMGYDREKAEVCCLANVGINKSWSINVLSTGESPIEVGVLDESTALNMEFSKGSVLGSVLSDLPLLSSDGVTNQSLKAPKKGKPFIFGQGDTIRFRLNLEAWILEISNEDRQKWVAIQLYEQTLPNKYMPCVFLSKGSSVELVGNQ